MAFWAPFGGLGHYLSWFRGSGKYQPTRTFSLRPRTRLRGQVFQQSPTNSTHQYGSCFAAENGCDDTSHLCRGGVSLRTSPCTCTEMRPQTLCCLASRGGTGPYVFCVEPCYLGSNGGARVLRLFCRAACCAQIKSASSKEHLLARRLRPDRGASFCTVSWGGDNLSNLFANARTWP